MKTSLMILVLLSCPVLAFGQDAPQEVSASQSYLSLEGSGISSLGNFKDDWDKGVGVYVGYGLVYPSHWGVNFQTGYISFRKNPSAELGSDPSFTIIPFMAGGRYCILMDRIRPYLFAMSGFNLVSEKYTRGGETIDEFLVKLNFQIGLGVELNLFSGFAIELAGKYNSHVLDPNLPYNATGLEYGLALKWTLGR